LSRAFQRYDTYPNIQTRSEVRREGGGSEAAPVHQSKKVVLSPTKPLKFNNFLSSEMRDSLKLTYGYAEYQRFAGEDPRTPNFKQNEGRGGARYAEGGVLGIEERWQGKGRKGEGRG
jgi:hypothetical protein